MAKKRKQIRRWVRFYEDFLYSDINRKIMGMKDGPFIITTYYAMCILAGKSGGTLYDMDGREKKPFNVNCLVALYPDFSGKKFERAISTLVEYGLLAPVTGGGYAVCGFRELGGQETYEARECRFKRIGSPCYLPWEKEAAGTPDAACEADGTHGPRLNEATRRGKETRNCSSRKAANSFTGAADSPGTDDNASLEVAADSSRTPASPTSETEHAYNNTRARGVTSTYVSIPESDRNEGTTLRNTPDRNLGTYVNIRRDENDYDSEGKLDRIGGMGGREGRKGTSDPSALETPETGIFNPAGFRTDATESTDPGEDTGQETLFGPDPLETEKPKKARAGRNREPAGPPVLTIPTKEGYDYGVTQRQIDTLREIYPDVDVMMNIRRIAARFENSPESRIGIAGVYRYLDNWMANEHRDAKKPADTPDRPKPASPGPDRSEPASPGPASPEDDSLASEPWYDPNDPYVIHGTDEELFSTDPNVDLLHDPYYLAEKALWKRFMGGA